MINQSSLTFLTIVIVIAIVITLLWLLSRPTHKSIVSGPAVLTSIGIFGTFLGVALSLTNFETTNIANSIPAFLGGIKLAFWSSVAGILAGLIHKIYFLKDRIPTQGAEEIGNLSSSLQSLHSSLGSLEATAERAAADLGEGDKQNVTEIVQGLGNIGDKLEQGMESDRATREQLVQMSKGMMSAFADNEDVLQHFRSVADADRSALGESVESLADRFDSSVQALNSSFIDLHSQSDALAEKFGQAITELGDRLTQQAGLDRAATIEQVNALNEKFENTVEHLTDSFGNLDEKAGSLSGRIGDAAKELGDKLSQQAGLDRASTIEQVNALNEKFENTVNQLNDSFTELNGKTDALATSLAGSFGDSLDKLGDRLAATSNELDVGALSDALSGSFRESIDKLGDQLAAANGTTDISALSDALSGKLGESIDKLGDRLASADGGIDIGALSDTLSGKFGESMEKLGEHLTAATAAMDVNALTDALSGNIGDSLEKLGDRLTATNVAGEIVALRDALTASFGETVGGLAEKLSAEAQEDRKKMMERLENLSGVLGGLNVAADANLSDADTLRAVGDLLSANVGKSMQELADKFGGDAAANREALSAQINALVEKFGGDALASREALSAQMGTLADKFGDVMAGVKDQIHADTLALGSQTEQMAKQFVDTVDALSGQLESASKADREGMENLSVKFAESMQTLSDSLSGEAKAERDAMTKAVGDLVEKFGGNAAELSALMTEEFKKLTEELGTATELNNKALLTLVKNLIHDTMDSNQSIVNELDKLLNDIAVQRKAETHKTEEFIKQLRTMSESDKATILQSTSELKAQMAEDFKMSQKLTKEYIEAVTDVVERNQLRSLERLEGIAGIMEKAVSSSVDIGEIIQNNHNTMDRMQEAFAGTHDGSLGRLLQDLNEKSIKQLKSLERSMLDVLEREPR